MIASGAAFSDWFLTDGTGDDHILEDYGSTFSRPQEDVEVGSSHHPVDSSQHSFNNDDTVRLRPIELRDRHIIQALHEQWFPVSYHDEFYDDLAAGRPGRFGEPLYSCLAVKKKQSNDASEVSTSMTEASEVIIASVVGTFVPATSLNDEALYKRLIADPRYTRMFYLMTLGCQDEYRKEGWGTTMVEQALQHAMQDQRCGVIYLHVITFNHAAIRLYEKLGFRRVQEIVNYYSIEGRKYNCFLYARFLNGNRGYLGVMSRVTNAFASFWKQLFVLPLNLWVEVTGTNNRQRLI